MVPLLLPVVLDFYRDPRRFPALRDPAGPLPGGISELLNWVGGADDTQSHGIAQQLGSSTNELHEAVRFFVKEALFRAEGDSYRTLGLGPDADIGQIKRHYRQLMSLFHPDRDTSGHNWETDYAPLINDAYNTLKRSHRGQGSSNTQNVWGANARGPRARVASGPKESAGGWGTQQGPGPGVRQQLGRRPPKNSPRASGFGRSAGSSQQSPLSPVSALFTVWVSTLVSALKTLFTGLTSALLVLGKGLGGLVHGLVSRMPAGLHPGVYVLVGSVVVTIVFLAFKDPAPPAMVLHTPPPGAGNPTEAAEPSALEQQRLQEAQAAQERQQEEQQRLAMLAEKAAAEKAAAEQAALEIAAAEKAAAEAEAQRQLLAAQAAEKAAAEAELKRKAMEEALAKQRAQEAEARRLAELKAQQEAEARLVAEQKAKEQEALRVAKEKAEAAEARRLAEEAQLAKRAEEERLAALAAQAEAERKAKERELALQREQEAQARLLAEQRALAEQKAQEQEAIRLAKEQAEAEEAQRLAAARRAEQAVKTLFTDLAAAYEAEDAGLFTTFFTADAVTSDAVGQEAILRLYEGFFAANEADEFSYRSLSWQRLPAAQGAPQDASDSASNPQQVAVRLPDYAVTAKVTIATRARDGSGGRTIEVPITFRVTPMTNGYAIASMEY